MSNKEIYELLKKAVNICKQVSDKNGYVIEYITFPLERNGIDINTIDVYDETKDYETAFRALYHWNEYKSKEIIDQKNSVNDTTAETYSSLISTYYMNFDMEDYQRIIRHWEYSETLKKYNLY